MPTPSDKGIRPAGDVRRFSQLKECLARISDNVLSTVLNELVKEGLIEKKIFGEIPVRVEYNVT